MLALQLDLDGNGCLDLDEFKALFLEIKSRFTCTPAAAAGEILPKRPNERTAEDISRLKHLLSTALPQFGRLQQPLLTEVGVRELGHQCSS